MDGWTSQLKDLWVNSLLPVIAFFWIWIVTFLFFFKGIDVQATNVSIFKIVYTAFALICIISFQFSRDFWQKMIIRFWTFVIIYAVFVFIATFLFQIASIRDFCYNIGLTQKWQHDIGLPTFDMPEFFLFLLVESFIIIVVVMLQLLLHKAPPTPSIPFESVEKMVEILDTFFDITKLTVFGIIMTCIAKVNAIHFCFIIAAVLSMVLKRTIRYVIIQLISVSAAILLVSQMIMQLNFFSDVKNVTCIVSRTENITLSNGAWLGFGKIESGESMLFNVAGYICIIALVTLYTIIVKEKNIIQGLRQEAGWNPYKMFNDPAYLDADKDFISYMKYLLKYGFYRYGIELTLFCIAMLIQARLDVWALVYSIWLVAFVLCRHSLLAVIWPIFKYFVLVSIPLQYAAALGFWPEKCFGYVLEKDEIYKHAFGWLYLPIGTSKPDTFKLFWDSLVFLFALCQSNVFDFERKHANENFVEMSPTVTSHSNPDAVVHPTTTFGLIRYAMFCSFPMISAVAFFFAATSGITLFSIGYGVGFMLILWYADNYFLRPTQQTIQFWKYLLIFNVITILVKTALQIPGCIFMHYLVEHSCWIVQLLGITCLKLSTKTIAFFKVPIISTAAASQNSCWYVPTSVGIEWDVFCFISLMFHKRFLRSIYFSEMSKEAILGVKFSYRAAKILEELNVQEMHEMREKYKKSMEKIQRTMARLKEAQKRIRGLKIAEPLNHQEAVTSGDYYMFDDMDKGVKLSSEAEEDEEALKTKDECGMSPSTPNVGKLMEAVMKTDIEQALKIAESASSSSNKSSPTSSTGSKAKCFDCNCKTREAAELTIEEQEKKEKLQTLAKTGKQTKEKKVVPSVIVVKDEKLLPTVNFDRRKSLKITVKPTSKPTKTVEEKSKTKCLCGCENCACRLRFFTKTCNTICLTIRFAIAFVNGCMISVCQIFNEIAYDYKYIRKQLYREKMLAANKSIAVSPISGSDLITVSSEKDKMELAYQVPIYIRLLMSFYDVIMSSFNTVCFLAVLLLQMRNPTIFTLPLSMMVLLWGSLSVPRPTKRFWKVLLSYTAVLLILDSVLRIQFIQVDVELLKYKYLHVQIFDIDKGDDYSIYYLCVILALFLQRRILMNVGMWNYDESSSQKRRGNVIRLFYTSLKNFFNKLIYENYQRIPVDVYTPIFLCDFINIFVFIFGFAAITEKREDGVSRYFAENKIPPSMLILFITQCLGVFVDRWIYLRKHVLAKLVFQIVQIILIHSCLFLLLPNITTIKFNQMFFPSSWYALKSIYFLLSAYQLRRGYPASVHGHALCQSYSVVNVYLYQFYLLFPFVYELRTVTDWMWTETTLTLTEWVGMEDIFCTVFQLKCWRNYDNKYSYRRGQKITSTVKFLLGGGIVLLFFLILLFPLAFFTFGRVAGKVNLPTEMELTFRIGSYDPIFSSYSVDIRSITTKQWKDLNDKFDTVPRAITFLSEYYSDDVGIVYLSNHSQKRWNLNPVFKEELIKQLKSDSPPQMLTQWKLNRQTENLKQPNDVTGVHSTQLGKSACDSLLGILNDNATLNNFTGIEVAPKFLKVGNLATAYPVDSLMEQYDRSTADHSTSPYINVTFQYERDGDDGWWRATPDYSDGRTTNGAKAADNAVINGNVSDSNKHLIIFTFNDKIFSPGIFSYFSAQGILGLYTTFLISLGFVIRKLCRGRTNQVFLDYLPNVDSILQLLLDIYFVREHKDGKLEEDLYAKLIFLFRSPETLIRWTRMPEESD